MVGIDTVYQRVLAIANKEQRGYVTPLEFNLLANQAQMALFEQYFYDLDQTKRRPSDETSFSDMPELIQNKLDPFKSTVAVTGGGTRFPANYRTGKIFYNSEGAGFTQQWRAVEKMEWNDLENILQSSFHREALRYQPMYRDSRITGRDIEVYGWDPTSSPTTGGVMQITSLIRVEIITAPGKVEWGYDVVNERALYNASGSTQNFFLHKSEETNLVIKILELAGIIVQDPGIIQYADNEDTKRIQQEKA